MEDLRPHPNGPARIPTDDGAGRDLKKTESCGKTRLRTHFSEVRPPIAECTQRLQDAGMRPTASDPQVSVSELRSRMVARTREGRTPTRFPPVRTESNPPSFRAGRFWTNSRTTS